MSYSIKIGHIYPDLLDMYGDAGNIASLTKRMIWRGYEAEVISFKLGDEINFSDVDILLLGGGSDAAEKQAISALSTYKEDFKEYAEGGGCILALCGGYPMLGNYILENGNKTDCLGILDIHTEKQNTRFSGNVCANISFGEEYSIVGFENHFGKTFIGSHSPLLKLTKGVGNGDGYEGVLYKNVFATYLHGPLLPKNPKLADEILKRALKRKYGKEITLSELDDSLENVAHNQAKNL